MKTKQLSCCLALTLLAVSAWADPYHHEATGIIFPDVLAGLDKDAEVVDYEARQAGLGISVRYGSPASKVDVYLYTMGRDSIPGDLHAPLVKEHFMQASEEIIGVAEQGLYENFKVLSEGELASKEAGVLPVWRAIYLFSRAGQDYRSYLYVATFHNHFLKVRYTILAESADDHDRDADDFWAALCHLLPTDQ